MIKTDIIIIGAGPVGLFAVFEAGLMKLKCHLIDVIPMPGGQLTEIYPKKPIYDIPGYPTILAGELIDNLMEQASPFKPGFTLGEHFGSLGSTTLKHSSAPIPFKHRSYGIARLSQLQGTFSPLGQGTCNGSSWACTEPATNKSINTENNLSI